MAFSNGIAIALRASIDERVAAPNPVGDLRAPPRPSLPVVTVTGRSVGVSMAKPSVDRLQDNAQIEP